ncbi:MAG: hypothetical protein D6785_05510 [Planctomycetota bacterium]|nr:MAG: hypothetical protein D6785_05510 [Planctomycetota bacterium]
MSDDFISPSSQEPLESKNNQKKSIASALDEQIIRKLIKETILEVLGYSHPLFSSLVQDNLSSLAGLAKDISTKSKISKGELKKPLEEEKPAKLEEILDVAKETQARRVHIVPKGGGFQVYWEGPWGMEKGISLALEEGKKWISFLTSNYPEQKGEWQAQNSASSKIGQQKPFLFSYSILETLKGPRIVLSLEDPLIAGEDHLGWCEEEIAKLQRLWQRDKGFLIISGPPQSGKTRLLEKLFAADEVEEKHESFWINPYPRRFLKHIHYLEPSMSLSIEEEVRRILPHGPRRIILPYEIGAFSLLYSYGNQTLLVIEIPETHFSFTLKKYFQEIPSPSLAYLYLQGGASTGLLPKLCPHCKEPQNLSPKQDYLFQKIFSTCETPPRPFLKKGCEKCQSRGYQEMIPFLWVWSDEELMEGQEEGWGMLEWKKWEKVQILLESEEVAWQDALPFLPSQI